jgi:hypothetical protein
MRNTLVDRLRNHLLVTKATIRDYEPGDLGRVLDLWGRADESGDAGGLTLDQAVDLMSSGPSATVVAEIEGDIVGSVIGSSSAASAGCIASPCCPHRVGVLFTLRDGRITRYDEHQDKAGALEAAGLSE